jgi:hypothetical protein
MLCKAYEVGLRQFVRQNQTDEKSCESVTMLVQTGIIAPRKAIVLRRALKASNQETSKETHYKS